MMIDVKKLVVMIGLAALPVLATAACGDNDGDEACIGDEDEEGGETDDDDADEECDDGNEGDDGDEG